MPQNRAFNKIRQVYEMSKLMETRTSGAAACAALNVSLPTVTRANREIRNAGGPAAWRAQHAEVLATMGIKVEETAAMIGMPNPQGFITTKTCVHIKTDETGATVVNEWRRSEPTLDMIHAAIDGMVDRVPCLPRIPKVANKASELLLEVVVPDLHFGMLAWKAETRGEDYDLDIARRALVTSVAMLIDRSPAVGKIQLVMLGDTFHSDNRSGMTERSGHILDTDSRYVRRIDAAIAAIMDVVEYAATKAPVVDVIVIPGNHDWHSSHWLSRVLKAAYRESPQIAIEQSPAPRQYRQHGRCMMAYAHGDGRVGMKELPMVMATEAAEIWAATVHRRGRLGHLHSRKRTEQTASECPGVIVEHLPTIAPADAYASDNGYRSQRAGMAWVWHARHGFNTCHEVSGEEVWEAMKG
jgi:hypothetical protein